MAFGKFLILSKPPLRDADSRRLLRMGGCVEGRTALIPVIVGFILALSLNAGGA